MKGIQSVKKGRASGFFLIYWKQVMKMLTKEQEQRQASRGSQWHECREPRLFCIERSLSGCFYSQKGFESPLSFAYRQKAGIQYAFWNGEKT